jgi:hypothetical protein
MKNYLVGCQPYIGDSQLKISSQGLVTLAKRHVKGCLPNCVKY